MLKQLSERADLFRKIHTFVRTRTIYDAFAVIGHTTFRIAGKMM